MIVPMEKLTLLCLAADREAMLRSLRSLGVVHITPIQPPAGASLDAARGRRDLIERALDLIPAGREEEAETPKDLDEVLADIEGLRREHLTLQEDLAGLRRQRHLQAPYGSFDPDLVRQLAEAGVSVQLYQATRGRDVHLPDGAVCVELGEDRSTRYLAVMARGEAEVDATPFPLPELSLPDLEAAVLQAEARLAENQARLDGYGRCAGLLARALDEARDEVRFLEVGAGMGASSDLAYLQGFCPVESVDGVRRAADEQGWGLLVEKPGADEEIPTLLRHPNWVKPIKVVLDFIGVLPGYREVDISGLFLVFFSIFFAMIVGDAGYGLLFLALTLAGRKWLPAAPSVLWRLLMIMSLGTIVWGLLSGNFFGIAALPAPLQALRVSWLGDDRNLMWLCFLIGAVHLTIAHGWNMVRYSNSLQALAQAGWIGLTWTMFFAARTMVLGQPFPAPVWWLFAAGFLLVLVFMQPFRKIATEWHNYVMLPLNIVSNFVDVVSYVRLFAVGIATFAVASAFNEMGLGLGGGGWVSGLIGALVIFVGHAFNIVLALMGVLVHGVRLNTLEFSGHLGLTWSGSKYTPFAATSRKEAAVPDGTEYSPSTR